jgi:hypothetical protein
MIHGDEMQWEKFYKCLDYLKEKKMTTNGFRISRDCNNGDITIRYQNILIEEKNMNLAFKQFKKQLTNK